MLYLSKHSASRSVPQALLFESTLNASTNSTRACGTDHTASLPLWLNAVTSQQYGLPTVSVERSHCTRIALGVLPVPHSSVLDLPYCYTMAGCTGTAEHGSAWVSTGQHGSAEHVPHSGVQVCEYVQHLLLDPFSHVHAAATSGSRAGASETTNIAGGGSTGPHGPARVSMGQNASARVSTRPHLCTACGRAENANG